MHQRPTSRSVFDDSEDEDEDSEPALSAASAAGIFPEGSRFGAYVIGPCIGHGGMARIYRAEHEGLRRQVALKVLTTGVAPGTEGRARFVREARIAAAIKHPNVVNIFDVGLHDRVPYLVMELLVGQDLEAYLHQHGALDEATIIDLIVPVVAGLVAVHGAGVVHRDLKPGNIFLAQGANDEIEPKLLDFGISKATDWEKQRLTSATQGLLMGTPLYMSPEALLGNEMTPLSDQYSLGVVLYECASGLNPFIADNVAETARRVTSGDYVPLTAQPHRPSRRLAAIIERAMSIDPADRFPDMRALGQELLTLAGQRTRITWSLTFGEGAIVPRAFHTGPTPKLPRGKRRDRAHLRWPLLGIGALVALAAGAVLTWPSSARGPLDEAPLAAAPPPPLEQLVAPVTPVLRDSVGTPRSPLSERLALMPVTSPSEADDTARQEALAPRERLALRENTAAPPAASAPSAAPKPAATPKPQRSRQRAAVARAPEPPPPAPEIDEPPDWLLSPTPSRSTRQSEAEEAASPDWVLTPPRARSSRPSLRSLPTGTNHAPIFD